MSVRWQHFKYLGLEIHLKLNITGRHGILLDPALDLSTRMADLTDDQTSMRLRRRSQLFERLESLAGEVRLPWDDGVAHGLELVVLDHDVARQDGSQLAFAPSLVDVDEVLGRNASGLEVLGVP